MLKGTLLIGNHNLSDLRIVRITPTPLDEVFYLYNIFICMENKRYLDKVLDHLVNRTKIDYEKELLFLPFSSQSLSLSSLSHSTLILSYYPPYNFIGYCENIYGLTIKETNYVWKEYKKIILDKIEDGE